MKDSHAVILCLCLLVGAGIVVLGAIVTPRTRFELHSIPPRSELYRIDTWTGEASMLSSAQNGTGKYVSYWDPIDQYKPTPPAPPPEKGMTPKEKTRHKLETLLTAIYSLTPEEREAMKTMEAEAQADALNPPEY